MLMTVEQWKEQSSAGRFRTRRNPLLLQIDRLLARYHGVVGGDEDAVIQRTVLLAALVSRTGLYLRDHACKEAFKAVAEELGLAAVEELKRLRRPAAPRSPGDTLARVIHIHGRQHIGGGFHPTIPLRHEHYVIEAFPAADGLRLPPDDVAHMLKMWLARHAEAAAAGTTPPSASFWDWLGDGDRARFFRSRVAYLDATEREAYRVSIDGNRWNWVSDGSLLSSTRLGDVAGWSFIFVISPEKVLYAGETRKDKFHHSSFLAGGPVLGAGEIRVHEGRLERVTNVSGHYRPDLKRHFNTLLFLAQRGVDLSRVKSRAVGFAPHGPEEDQGARHLALLFMHLSKPLPFWSMTPEEKLRRFADLSPEAREKFMRERSLSEGEYEAGLLYRESASSDGAMPSGTEATAIRLFSQAASSAGLSYFPVSAD